MKSAKGNLFNRMWLAIAFMAVALACFGQYPDKPNPPRLVNDYAGLLSAGENQTLENKLVAYDDSTSTQIAVVIIRSLGGADKAQYATELYEHWGVGRAKEDNGVLILVASEDRQMFISTGRGVEEYLPDAICKRIVEDKMKPNFKQAAYYAGLNAATDEMIARLSGTYVNEEPRRSGKKDLSIWQVIGIIIFIIIVVISISNRGGGGTTYGGRGFNSWGGGFGGFGGGGFGGGSSSGGGGFGGFGGGSSGGGGAGGSW